LLQRSGSFYWRFLSDFHAEAFDMRKAVLLCVLSAIVGGVAAFGLHGTPPTDSQSAPPEASSWSPPGPAASQPAAGEPSQLDSLTAEERVNVFVYQKANRSVVNINTKVITGNLFVSYEQLEGGSGSVIDQQGHVLTNFHVVKAAKKIDVTLSDGSTYPAQLVGGDGETDVAVLKINAPADKLAPVTFGSSSNLLVGQRVFAIGSPFGFERTMSTGIISSLDRTLPNPHSPLPLKSIIQIDASINPGNSGGPLLDAHARVIGMNVAIATNPNSRSEQSAGVGFAIPINTIARVVPQLIQNGRVQRADAGIVKVLQTDRGLLIAMMTPAGPAQRAGLQGPRVEEKEQRQGPFVTKYRNVNWAAADMIVAVDGRPIKTAEDFLSAVEAKQPGQQVVITVVRAGQQLDVPLTLGSGG
jgi:S1-C subfamily serine protease